MPGCRCAVFGCNNSRIATKAKGEDVVYHRFPRETDLESKTVRSEWIRQCRRADKWNPDTSTICSAHFCEDDYKRDLQNELLGLPLRCILKKTAVPTMNLPKPGSQSESPRKRRLEKKKRKKEDNDLITSDPQPSTSQAENIDKSADNSPIRRILKKTSVPTKNLPKPGSQSESPRKRRLEKRKRKQEFNNLRTFSDTEPSTSQSEDIDTSAGISPTRRILKKTAVPSTSLSIPESQSESPRKRRLEKKKRKKGVYNLRTSTDPQSFTSQAENINTSADNSSADYDYEVKYNELLREHSKLKTDFLRLRRSTTTKIKSLNNQLSYSKNKCAKLEKKKKP